MHHNGSHFYSPRSASPLLSTAKINNNEIFKNNTITLSEFQSRYESDYYSTPNFTPTSFIVEDIMDERVQHACANFNNNSAVEIKNYEPFNFGENSILRKKSSTTFLDNNLIERRRNSGHFSPQLRHNSQINSNFQNETVYERKNVFSESEADSALPSSSCASTSSGLGGTNHTVSQLSPTALSSNSSTSSNCYENSYRFLLKENNENMNRSRNNNEKNERKKRFQQIGHGIWAKKSSIEKEETSTTPLSLRTKSVEPYIKRSIFFNISNINKVRIIKICPDSDPAELFKRSNFLIW